ncbi:MAG: GFA family protein [Candidatus Dadabacteria bacterium]|nr:MAG: GFA family protein [Candidatus Dadabacteria bacterium]
MVKGSCLCGAVVYGLEGELGPMADCHCSMCRKHHGATAVTYVGVRTANFRWLAGQDKVATYQSSPRVRRGFCKICGSSLPVPDENEEMTLVPAGTLDDDPGVRRMAHIFVASRAPWDEITDGLPCFDEYPPGMAPDERNSGS